MIRWIKGWAQLVAGAVVFALGFISIVNFSFEWEFIMPPSTVLAAVMIVGGGILFAHGLVALDSPPETSVSQSDQQRMRNKE